MINNIAFFVSFLYSFLLFAVPVAIIDSGTDFDHIYLHENLIEPLDLTDNEIDDDENGYIDDSYGWNFADNTSLQVDRSKMPEEFPDYVRGISILMALNSNIPVSDDDYAWIKEKWHGENGDHFKQAIGIAAYLSHGTHVSGITLRESRFSADIMALQIMPTMDFSAINEPSNNESVIHEANKDISDEEIIQHFKTWAEQNKNSWLDEINMLTYRGTRVANCSFGFAYDNALQFAKRLCSQLNITCDEARHDRIARAFLTHYKRPDSIRLISTNPEIFFVVASGNNGVDNDLYPDEPGNYVTDNKITVASYNYQKTDLAPFSNYGKTTVDVAVPGVFINSSYPVDLYGKMSGTSQAAPWVTGVAAKIFDLNENLQANDVKKILIETVDRKEWLSEKILSGGTVNAERAFRAAELSVEMPLSEAISGAIAEIPDSVDALPDDKKSPPRFVDNEIKLFAEDLIKSGMPVI